ncbi:putative secreted protein [Sinobacterium caligoides]|uniref:Putative secreted protein n=1 Tax=Sinobacterium caligoides TaxID=933926 RepID=A0A3N2DZ94_9GAMM|nr:VPLPA-CTERM sorting domain-containing protein [Sinobacterium caligoides]ROS04615.1 putative secreted protein [Sinobacterium caligoides]
MNFKTIALTAATLALSVNTHGAIVTFTDTDLASGNPLSVDGVTLTTSNTGGSIAFIGSGIYTGLHLGGSNTGGSYSLSFSESISSIEIEFDALSGAEVTITPVETLFNFSTENGAANIAYTNQFGTTFDGSTITTTEPDGQGIIDFSDIGLFNTFSFDHDQGTQAGFVIERIVIETNEVPIPAAAWLFGTSLVGLVGIARRRKA